MNKAPRIIILAGTKSEESRLEGNFPHYLTEADGVPLIQSLIESCATLSPEKIICMLPVAEVNKYHLRNMVSQIHPAAVAQSVHGATMGAACTALLASDYIDIDAELVIISANEILYEPFHKIVTSFRADGSDAGVVIFKSLNPRYAYVRLTEASEVVEATKKNPISSHAVAGFYWFKSGMMFVDAVKSMIRKDAKVNDAFYIAPALNELVLQHKKIGVYRVNSDQYRPLKDSAQVHSYEFHGRHV